MDADLYHGYKSIVTFTETTSQESWITNAYPLWSDTHVKTKFRNLFQDKNGNYIQDPDELTTPRDDFKARLGDYELRVATIYFGDVDGSSNLSTGDTIFEVAESGPQLFTLTDWPIIYRLKPNKCEPATIIRIIGYNFGDTQGDSTVHIGPKTFGPGHQRIKLWSNTKIKVRIPNYKCDWFKDKNYRYRKVWVTVDGIDSNKKKLKVIKPATCP